MRRKGDVQVIPVRHGLGGEGSRGIAGPLIRAPPVRHGPVWSRDRRTAPAGALGGCAPARPVGSGPPISPDGEMGRTPPTSFSPAPSGGRPQLWRLSLAAGLDQGGARPLSLIGSSRRGNLLRRLPIPAPHLPPPPPPPCITQGGGEREHAGAHERDCITFQADRRAHPGAGPRLRASYVPGGQKNSPPAGGSAGGLERFTLCITQRRGPNPIAGCCLLCCVRVGFPLCGTTRSLILSCRARSVNPWWTLRARFLSVSGVCVIHRPPEL